MSIDVALIQYLWGTMRGRIKSARTHRLDSNYYSYVVITCLLDTGQLEDFNCLHFKTEFEKYIGKVINFDTFEASCLVNPSHYDLKSVKNVMAGNSVDVFKFRRSTGI